MSRMYALLGPYAIAGAARSLKLQSSAIVEPQLLRHIALAVSQHERLTLAGKTVMQLVKEVAQEARADAMPVDAE